MIDKNKKHKNENLDKLESYTALRGDLVKKKRLRLAQALRLNLKKRKTQFRGRSALPQSVSKNQ